MSDVRVPLDARTRKVVLNDLGAALRVTRRAPAAAQALEEWESAGYPSGLGSTSIGSATHCDPVGAAAIAAASTGRRPDEMSARLEQLDRELVAARDALHRAAVIVAWATQPTQALGADGCALCARSRHSQRYQQVYARIPRDPADTGSVSIPVCSWHYDFRRRWGVNPHPAIVEEHLNGAPRIPKRLIAEHHPDAFRAALDSGRATA